MTVTGRIVGPDDQPVQDAWIIGRAASGRVRRPGACGRADYHGNASNGRFELHGLDPDTELSGLFPRAQAQARRDGPALGQVSSRRTRVTVRLEPCGTATARLVDADGRPVAGYRDELLISMVVTPGPEPAQPRPRRRERLFGRSGYACPGSIPINYCEGAGVRRPGPDHIPGPDPRRDLSHHRPHDDPRSVTACSSAKTSPSSPARPSTWAIS